MEFVPSVDGASGGGWRRAEGMAGKWQQGGLDLNKPSTTSGQSSYNRLMYEVENKRGVFSDRGLDGVQLETPYIPPWRQTMYELYGKEAVDKMKAPIESYEKRATRFAREEQQRRTSGSRAKLLEALGE